MKSGFVNIFGRPNAGKSTLLNALAGEKLAIISPKVQTTRHRIKAFLNGEGYQIILSDTPGIIKPEYKLHEKMMQSVRSSLEDADVAILLADASDVPEKMDEVFSNLRLKVPVILALNKVDKVSEARQKEMIAFFSARPYGKEILTLSALKQTHTDDLLKAVLAHLPEGLLKRIREDGRFAHNVRGSFCPNPGWEQAAREAKAKPPEVRKPGEALKTPPAAPVQAAPPPSAKS
jgi:GTP-binding protein Era